MLQKSRFASKASSCSFARSDPLSSSLRRHPLTSSTKFKYRWLGLVIWRFAPFSAAVIEPLAHGNMKCSPTFLDLHLFAFESSDVDFWCHVVFHFFRICHGQVSRPAALLVQGISSENTFGRLGADLMNLVLVLGGNWISKFPVVSSFMRSFPNLQEDLDFFETHNIPSLISIVHLILTGLTVLSAIPFVSDRCWCRCAMLSISDLRKLLWTPLNDQCKSLQACFLEVGNAA